MFRRLRSVRRLVAELPQQLRLTYCLVHDDRVPLHLKAALGTALALIVTPVIDLPAIIPLVGELDVLALTLLALRLFISACPQDAVAGQHQLILERRSRFDHDLMAGERMASGLGRVLGMLLHRMGERGGARGRQRERSASGHGGVDAAEDDVEERSEVVV